MMAGIAFAGLSAAWKVRLFTISPASPWAWAALFFLFYFTYYGFHRISHECRPVVGGPREPPYPRAADNLSTALRHNGLVRSSAPGLRGSLWRCCFRRR